MKTLALLALLFAFAAPAFAGGGRYPEPRNPPPKPPYPAIMPKPKYPEPPIIVPKRQAPLRWCVFFDTCGVP